ncbi:hypothetical protein BJ508DRAFT_359463 [Ascobolus immersus RN42]|uniref:Uncharacterized protein n=1 Tax=Ascobolus immersus RN42 TaxID=1160509 RepID=A0A3N4IF11_ASCIM|nr:hypothetical protein BJ508DRAFT_359463 [Ascobolus immersus RN42]
MAKGPAAMDPTSSSVLAKDDSKIRPKKDSDFSSSSEEDITHTSDLKVQPNSNPCLGNLELSGTVTSDIHYADVSCGFATNPFDDPACVIVDGNALNDLVDSALVSSAYEPDKEELRERSSILTDSKHDACAKRMGSFRYEGGIPRVAAEVFEHERPQKMVTNPMKSRSTRNSSNVSSSVPLLSLEPEIPKMEEMKVQPTQSNRSLAKDSGASLVSLNRSNGNDTIKTSIASGSFISHTDFYRPGRGQVLQDVPDYDTLHRNPAGIDLNHEASVAWRVRHRKISEWRALVSMPAAPEVETVAPGSVQSEFSSVRKSSPVPVVEKLQGAALVEKLFKDHPELRIPPPLPPRHLPGLPSSDKGVEPVVAPGNRKIHKDHVDWKAGSVGQQCFEIPRSNLGPLSKEDEPAQDCDDSSCAIGTCTVPRPPKYEQSRGNLSGRMLPNEKKGEVDHQLQQETSFRRRLYSVSNKKKRHWYKDLSELFMSDEELLNSRSPQTHHHSHHNLQQPGMVKQNGVAPQESPLATGKSLSQSSLSDQSIIPVHYKVHQPNSTTQADDTPAGTETVELELFLVFNLSGDDFHLEKPDTHPCRMNLAFRPTPFCAVRNVSGEIASIKNFLREIHRQVRFAGSSILRNRWEVEYIENGIVRNNLFYMLDVWPELMIVALWHYIANMSPWDEKDVVFLQILCYYHQEISETKSELEESDKPQTGITNSGRKLDKVIRTVSQEDLGLIEAELSASEIYKSLRRNYYNLALELGLTPEEKDALHPPRAEPADTQLSINISNKLAASVQDKAPKKNQVSTQLPFNSGIASKSVTSLEGQPAEALKDAIMSLFRSDQKDSRIPSTLKTDQAAPAGGDKQVLANHKSKQASWMGGSSSQNPRSEVERSKKENLEGHGFKKRSQMTIYGTHLQVPRAPFGTSGATIALDPVPAFMQQQVRPTTPLFGGSNLSDSSNPRASGSHLRSTVGIVPQVGYLSCPIAATVYPGLGYSPQIVPAQPLHAPSGSLQAVEQSPSALPTKAMPQESRVQTLGANTVNKARLKETFQPQAEQKMPAIDIGDNSVVDDFFLRYGGIHFRINWTCPMEVELKRMSSEYGWNSTKWRRVRMNFHRAVADDFDRKFGDSQVVDSWIALCVELGAVPDELDGISTIDGCLELISNKHVNVWDILNGRRMRKPVTNFHNKSALIDYTTNRRHFPRKAAKVGGALAMLLPYIGH